MPSRIGIERECRTIELQVFIPNVDGQLRRRCFTVETQMREWPPAIFREVSPDNAELNMLSCELVESFTKFPRVRRCSLIESCPHVGKCSFTVEAVFRPFRRK